MHVQIIEISAPVLGLALTEGRIQSAFPARTDPDCSDGCTHVFFDDHFIRVHDFQQRIYVRVRRGVAGPDLTSALLGFVTACDTSVGPPRTEKVRVSDHFDLRQQHADAFVKTYQNEMQTPRGVFIIPSDVMYHGLIMLEAENEVVGREAIAEWRERLMFFMMEHSCHVTPSKMSTTA